MDEAQESPHGYCIFNAQTTSPMNMLFEESPSVVHNYLLASSELHKTLERHRGTIGEALRMHLLRPLLVVAVTVPAIVAKPQDGKDKNITASSLPSSAPLPTLPPSHSVIPSQSSPFSVPSIDKPSSVSIDSITSDKAKPSFTYSGKDDKTSATTPATIPAHSKPSTTTSEDTKSTPFSDRDKDKPSTTSSGDNATAHTDKDKDKSALDTGYDKTSSSITRTSIPATDEPNAVASTKTVNFPDKDQGKSTILPDKDKDKPTSEEGKSKTRSPLLSGPSVPAKDQPSVVNLTSILTQSTPVGLTLSLTRPTTSLFSSRPESSLLTQMTSMNTGAPVIVYSVTIRPPSPVTTSSPYASKPEIASIGTAVLPSKDSIFQSKPSLTIVATDEVRSTTFPGFAIVPSPTVQPPSPSEKAPYPNATSATTPVWTPAMLGNAYGGGFIIKPSIYVTKLPYPNGPSEGVPPGYGSLSAPRVATNISNGSLPSGDKDKYSESSIQNGVNYHSPNSTHTSNKDVTVLPSFDSTIPMLSTISNSSLPSMGKDRPSEAPYQTELKYSTPLFSPTGGKDETALPSVTDLDLKSAPGQPSIITTDSAILLSVLPGSTTEAAASIATATVATTVTASSESAMLSFSGLGGEAETTLPPLVSAAILSAVESTNEMQPLPVGVGTSPTVIFGTKHVASGGPLPLASPASILAATLATSGGAPTVKVSSIVAISGEEAETSSTLGNGKSVLVIVGSTAYEIEASSEGSKFESAQASPFMGNGAVATSVATSLIGQTESAAAGGVVTSGGPAITASSLPPVPDSGSPKNPGPLNGEAGVSELLHSSAVATLGEISSAKDQTSASGKPYLAMTTTAVEGIAIPTILFNGLSSFVSTIDGLHVSTSATSPAGGSSSFPWIETTTAPGLVGAPSVGGNSVLEEGQSVVAGVVSQLSQAAAGPGEALNTAGGQPSVAIIAGITGIRGQPSSLAGTQSGYGTVTGSGGEAGPDETIAISTYVSLITTISPEQAAAMGQAASPTTRPTPGGIVTSSFATLSSNEYETAPFQASSAADTFAAGGITPNSFTTLSTSEQATFAGQAGVSSSNAAAVIASLPAGAEGGQAPESFPQSFLPPTGTQRVSSSGLGRASATGSVGYGNFSMLLNPTSMPIFEGSATKQSFGVLAALATILGCFMLL
ncbi:MAG: hypothetical protein Q9217_003879 [Psora testacea]